MLNQDELQRKNKADWLLVHLASVMYIHYVHFIMYINHWRKTILMHIIYLFRNTQHTYLPS